MSTQVLIDPSCDLPNGLIHKYNAGVLPVQLKLKGASFLDYRDNTSTTKHYTKDYLSGSTVDTSPADQGVLKRVLMNSYRTHDNVLVITPCRKRSEIYFNIQPIVNEINNRRKANAKIKILDSRSLFCGQSVLVAHALALTMKTDDINLIRRKLDRLTENIYSYMVPADLLHVRDRAKKRGDKSVSWVSAALAKTIDICPIVLFRNENTETIDKVKGFDHAIDYVMDAVKRQISEDNLKSPFVAISYAGEIERIKSRESYLTLATMAKRRHIEVIISQMSLTSAVHLGMGGLSISVACKVPPI